jgi:CheY-like chemotaxis protein
MRDVLSCQQIKLDFFGTGLPGYDYTIYFTMGEKNVTISTRGNHMQDPQTISILCIDAEPLFLDAFTQRLEREPGFSIVSASTVAEALELINTQYFDVIISDYAMPDMDGITLLQEIRARGCQSVFIMVTAKRLAHIAIDALNTGADYYLQKGAEAGPEITKLIEFIRKRVPERRAEHELTEWGRFYQSAIENHTDIICRIGPDGSFRFVSESGLHFFRKPYEELLKTSFFSLLPDDERQVVLLRLQNLSAIKPDILMEHSIAGGDGRPVVLQWSYHGFYTGTGAVSEYQVSGRDTGGLVSIGSPKQPVAARTSAAPARASPAPTAAPAPQEGPADWGGLVETIQSLDNPVFAVDKKGVIIAWNKGLEELTGISSSSMIGKGNYEYSVPFYGKPTLMLIDHIIRPSAGSGIGIKKAGDTYIGDVEHITIRGKPMLLWGKGSPVYDAKGSLIAAIEAITVGEPQKEMAGQEGYLGGISSITLKVSGEGLGGAIAGAIGSSTGGYGVYATTRRFFVIQNPDLNAESSKGVQFSTFMMDELFGTTVDTRQKSIPELEEQEIYSAEKADITKIELKKPVLLSGFLTISTKDRGSFRIYIDHKKAYTHIEQLMKSFLPEMLHIE